MHREITYKTLAPLHIGDGNTINQMGYYLHHGKIYFYEPDDLLQILTKDGVKKLTQYILSEKKPTLGGFITTCGRKGAIEQVQKYASYSCGFWGNSNKEPERIWTILKSRGKPYIPGSEIKGAIRTALQRNLILANSDGKSLIQKRIQEIKSRPQRDEIQKKKDISKELGKLDNELNSLVLRTKNDAKYDLLRFLLVSDAPMEQGEWVVANVAIKGGSKESADYHEFIKEGAVFRGKITLSNEKQFEKFTSSLKVDNNKKALFSKLDEIFKACYETTQEIIDQEITFYKGLQMYGTVKQLENIKNQNTKDSPVIRVGKHQGFISLTLYNVISKLGDSVRKIYLDLLEAINKNIHANNFPKTRRVIIRNKGEELTTGWVKIEINP